MAARLLLALLAASPWGLAKAHAQVAFGTKKYDYQPADVLPEATEFERKDSYWEGYGPGAEERRSLLGYVFVTDDLVQIPGYSGHSINTLVGINPAGKIVGVKIVQHAEPIVLIGLSEQVIHDFVAQYVGKDIRDRILISDQPHEGYTRVDGISGATVTAVAENATILEAGRTVGRAVGIVKAYEVRKRRPLKQFAPHTWRDLVAVGALGQLVLKADEVGGSGSEPVLNVRFTVLDPPVIGKNLVGERYYQMVQERVEKEGGSALYICSEGELSFKGAGFARGGIFDRFSIEQGKDQFVFRDTDYLNLPEPPIEGAPALREGGIFFLKNRNFDPTQPFVFHLTIPYRVQDRRAYGTFLAPFELPAAFIEEDLPFWRTRWQASALNTVAFALFLLVTAAIFAARQQLLAYRKLLHRSIAVVAAVWVGLVLKAQPSATQILTPANAAVRRVFPFEVFLSEPMIFLFWIAIAVSLVVWGRGFFCGWLCPYGALLELLAAGWKRIAPKQLHRRIDAWDPGRLGRAGKYVTFLVILAVALVSLPLAEMLDEVEPFKTFILRLARPFHFVAYFAVITLVSAVVYRFFCRFVCPLGGALAIPSRKPLLPLFRWEQCKTCKICYKGCEPKAIAYETGRINYGECLQCWDCQSTGMDQGVCPELIVAKREQRTPRPLVVLALLSAATLAVGVAQAAERVVLPGTGAITAAIAAGNDGDTIRLKPGVYSESVVIDKALALVGEDGAIIDAGGRSHVVAIASPNVRLEGVTLRSSGRGDAEVSHAGVRVEQSATDAQIINNRIEQSHFGIWIHGAERALIRGNHVAGLAELQQNARGNCVHLWSARGAVIADNDLDHCRDGIYMDLSMDATVTGNTVRNSRYAIHTMWCDRGNFSDNVVADNYVGLALMFSKNLDTSRNTLHNNSTHGLLLMQVTRSRANDNVIVGNTKGLFLYNSLFNTVRGNFIARNNLGVHYWGGSEDNDISENSFMANEIQVKYVSARDQTWNGNFWGDYVGWDLNNDGRGDVPYRSNTLVDALLWKYPSAKLLLSSPAFQVLAFAEREFPVIAAPKAVDNAPHMTPVTPNWTALLDRYPAAPKNYYGTLTKLEHLPGEN